MPTKKWYQSATIWVSVLSGAYGILIALAGQFPAWGWVTTVTAAITILLRMLRTNQPIEQTATRWQATLFRLRLARDIASQKANAPLELVVELCFKYMDDPIILIKIFLGMIILYSIIYWGDML